MTREEIIRTISRVVGDVVGLDDLALAPSTTAADVEGWDSLAHVQILVGLERAFRIRFRTGEMTALANVGELADRIAARLPAG